ncbi:MAG: hypothetical protein E7437_06425 [Ruminococcaceae bacterium]|nr:hypothetical protein [Oscillospiraceae bacterium]
MKRFLMLILVMLLCGGLWACAEEKEAAVTTQPTVVEDTWEGPTPEDEARDLIGSPVEELLNLVGTPEKIEYYPSPMSEDTDYPIEEGMYYYDSFVVVTLKEGESEMVYGVEPRVD